MGLLRLRMFDFYFKFTHSRLAAFEDSEVSTVYRANFAMVLPPHS